MARKTLLVISLVVSLLVLLFITSYVSKDTVAPVITNITTSNKFLSKSDCGNTTLTITTTITDDTKVQSASLWYRVGADQQFTSMPMKADGSNQYTATIITLEIPGGEYGSVEFSVVAEDEARNQSKSPVDSGVQLLACVSN
jgi:hypothetical protein